MDQVMSINEDVVSSAINQISTYTADIATRNKKIIQYLEDVNARTSGKFPLMKTLQERVQEEAINVQSIIDAQEEVRAALQRYMEVADEAADDDVFRV